MFRFDSRKGVCDELSRVCACVWLGILSLVSLLYAATAGRDERLTGVDCSIVLTSANVGRDNSSIRALFSDRRLRVGRMRRAGRRLRDEIFSLLLGKPKSRHDSMSSGRRGTRVVLGDRPKVGIASLSVSLVEEGGVGIAKKDKSSSSLSLLLSKRFKTGRPLWRSCWCAASVEGR